MSGDDSSTSSISSQGEFETYIEEITPLKVLSGSKCKSKAEKLAILTNIANNYDTYLNNFNSRDQWEIQKIIQPEFTGRDFQSDSLASKIVSLGETQDKFLNNRRISKRVCLNFQEITNTLAQANYLVKEQIATRERKLLRRNNKKSSQINEKGKFSGSQYFNTLLEPQPPWDKCPGCSHKQCVNLDRSYPGINT